MRNARATSLIPAPRAILTAFLIAALATLQLPPLAKTARAAIGQVFLPNTTASPGVVAGGVSTSLTQLRIEWTTNMIGGNGNDPLHYTSPDP
jgi:hypothetical protein